MFQYHIKNCQVLLPTDDFSKVSKHSEIIDATTTKTHLEYPDGLIVDIISSIYGADITINRELVKNSNGDYELKKD